MRSFQRRSLFQLLTSNFLNKRRSFSSIPSSSSNASSSSSMSENETGNGNGSGTISLNDFHRLSDQIMEEILNKMEKIEDLVDDSDISYSVRER
jgi:hypothetical protein